MSFLSKNLESEREDREHTDLILWLDHNPFDRCIAFLNNHPLSEQFSIWHLPWVCLTCWWFSGNSKCVKRWLWSAYFNTSIGHKNIVHNFSLFFGLICAHPSSHYRIGCYCREQFEYNSLEQTWEQAQHCWFVSWYWIIMLGIESWWGYDIESSIFVGVGAIEMEYLKKKRNGKKRIPMLMKNRGYFMGKCNENSHNRGFLLITGQNEYFVFYEMTVMTERVLEIEFCWRSLWIENLVTLECFLIMQ